MSVTESSTTNASEVGLTIKAGALKAVEQFLGSRPPTARNSRIPSLLEYVVREEVEGRGGRLKAFSIAVDVFGRGPEFDPQTDSIVRVEMYRLRTALAEHYKTVGRNDPVQISIPKGRYRPHFAEAEKPPAIIHPARMPTKPVASNANFMRRAAKLAASLAVVSLGFGFGYVSGQPTDENSVKVVEAGILNPDCPKDKSSQSAPLPKKQAGIVEKSDTA